MELSDIEKEAVKRLRDIGYFGERKRYILEITKDDNGEVKRATVRHYNMIKDNKEDAITTLEQVHEKTQVIPSWLVFYSRPVIEDLFTGRI